MDNACDKLVVKIDRGCLWEMVVAHGWGTRKDPNVPSGTKKRNCMVELELARVGLCTDAGRGLGIG